MTPEEHQSEFLYQAEKLGLDVKGNPIETIAAEVIHASLNSLRELNYCGAPCSSSELIPDPKWATMQHARHERPNEWLKSQVLMSSTYDGSISYLVAKGQERTKLGKIFSAICRAKLKDPQFMLDLYQLSENDNDDAALEKICQIVTDIGFYGAAVSGLLGAIQSKETTSHLALFDIGNPFPGVLEKGQFATHTWDVVSLLGPYDHMLSEDYKPGLSAWRQNIVNYCYTGEYPCESWRPTNQSAMIIQKDGIKCLNHIALNNSRAQKLLQFAENEGGEHGFDLLWENVVRFFLKTGNPRHSHEATAILAEYA